jgi:hypothetical protein
VNLYSGLCKLTCCRVEEQRESKARARHPNDGGLGAYQERVSSLASCSKPRECGITVSYLVPSLEGVSLTSSSDNCFRSRSREAESSQVVEREG